MYKNKIIILILLAEVYSLSAESYIIGDFVADFSDSLCTSNVEWTLYDYYGDLNGGENKVIWLVFFNASSRRCQLEAAYTQSIQNLFGNQGLVTVGIGSGWNNEFECKDWSKNYSVMYPIIKDDRLNIRSLFTEETVPHHVLIDHNMQIVYTAKGTIMPPMGNEFLLSINSAIQNMNVLSSVDDSQLPENPKLNSCFPNPFNSTTTISYSINQETPVNINVLDLQGRNKNSIKSYTSQTPGNYSFSWNSNQYASGVYFIQLVTNNDIQHQKVLLIK